MFLSNSKDVGGQRADALRALVGQDPSKEAIVIAIAELADFCIVEA